MLRWKNMLLAALVAAGMAPSPAPPPVQPQPTAVQQAGEGFPRGDGYQTVVFQLEQDFGKGRVVKVCTRVRRYAKGSFFSFEEVLDTWTEPVTPGDYTFHEAYSIATISGDKQKLQLQARGMVETKQTLSLLEIPVGEWREMNQFYTPGIAKEYTRYDRETATWGSIWVKKP